MLFNSNIFASNKIHHNVISVCLLLNSYGSMGLVGLRCESKHHHHWEGKIVAKTEVWNIVEGDIKWKRSGMLSLCLRGQVWPTIKTELHWQPSGNNPHISREGQDICKHPQLCAHTRFFFLNTHTYANTQQQQHLHEAGVKQTNYAVNLQFNGRLEGGLK